MNDSWRTPLGMSDSIFNRKPAGKASRRSFHRESKPLHPEDFDDVFGGPPGTVSSRQFSGGEFDRSCYFYDDIFQNPGRIGAEKGTRKLPEFRIPAGERGSAGAAGRRSEEFCGVFLRMDFNEVRRSRSRSKSNPASPSVLSSEEFSPFRPPVSDDDVFSPVYASKLRPTTEETLYSPYSRPSRQFVDDERTENFRSTNLNFSRRASSPESMSRGAYSYSSVKVSVVDDDDSISGFHKQGDDGDDDDDDEISSSYVIEINSSYREKSDEGVGVDEAIAWAKKSYQSLSSAEESADNIIDRSAVLQFPDESVDECKSLYLEREYPNKVKTEEEERKIDESKEMEQLEEDIKLWSSGKERNIELLLSTLQDILWPNSGWYPIPLTNLYESSHVKKAYQKARLCLHPDKLQQRGATLLQKYVAEIIFSILQEAWAAYKLQDIIISARG